MRFPRFKHVDNGSELEELNGRVQECLYCGRDLINMGLTNLDYTYNYCSIKGKQGCLRGFLTTMEVSEGNVRDRVVPIREKLATNETGLVDSTSSEMDEECRILAAVGQVDTRYDEGFNPNKEFKRFLWSEDGYYVGFIFWSYGRLPTIQQIFVEQGSRRTGVASKMVEKWADRVDGDKYQVLNPNELSYAFFESLEHNFEYYMQEGV